MCDHCDCRYLPEIARLMAEHDVLSELAQDVRAALRRDDDPGVDRLLHQLTATLGPHVRAEETGLFAVLRDSELAEHVASLRSEHDRIDAALADVAHRGPGWRALLGELLTLLDTHMYRENFGLFPGTLATLTPEQWDEIDARLSPATG